MPRSPRDSISIQRELNRNPEIESAWEDDFWGYLNERTLDFLSLTVAHLLRFAPGGDLASNTLVSKIERLKLQRKTRDQRLAAGTAESIAECNCRRK